MPQKKIRPRCIGPVGELANCWAAILYGGGNGLWTARTLRQRKSRSINPVMGGP